MEFLSKKGPNNGYTEAAQPLRGRRLMNVSGAMDRLVPYDGGPSSRIPAKGGRLAFLPAETSTFLWAQCMGFEGNSPQESMDANASMELFRYLNGDIIHINDPRQRPQCGIVSNRKDATRLSVAVMNDPESLADGLAGLRPDRTLQG